MIPNKRNRMLLSLVSSGCDMTPGKAYECSKLQNVVSDPKNPQKTKLQIRNFLLLFHQRKNAERLSNTEKELV